MRVNGDSLLGGITHDGTRGWGARGGFTLTELLVAMAVASVIFVGVASLFWGSMRAVRTGYQAIHVDEQSRNALSVVERDLTSAFTARQFGDYYQFYGTPIGFTFIGVANNLAAPEPGEPQNVGLARVTYVIYMGDRAKAHGLNDAGVITDEDIARIEQSSFGTTVVVSPSTPGGEAVTNDRTVITFPLVRLVEPNVQDLNNFPVDWNVAMSGSGSNPEFADSAQLQRVQMELAYACNRPGKIGDVDFLANPTGLNPAEEQLWAAKKRELWIRMLAGDPSVPNLWDLWRMAKPETLKSLGVASGNVADYIVATGLVYPELEDDVPGDNDLISKVVNTASTRVMIGDRGTDPMSPATPTDPWSGEKNRWLFGFFDQGGWTDAGNGPANDFEDVFEPVAGKVDEVLYLDGAPLANADEVQRFNAAYHRYAPFMYGAGIQPSWGTDANVMALMDDTAANESRDYTGVGSPLAPRIPAVVHVRLRFILPSPYIGAPDMVRLYTRAVDIPSGYARNAPTP